jgi:predicted MFS family arabinose efflux permease
MDASCRAERLEPALRRAAYATRRLFFATGLATASWAPMVPFAKARVGLSDSTLGLVLLGLGAGAMVAMPAAAVIMHRFGLRTVLLIVILLACIVLLPLATVASVVPLGLTLLLFGATIGTMDIAINAHAVATEQRSGRPLMSGFHALFSLGGLAGAAGMSALLRLGVPLPFCAICASALVAVVALPEIPHLLTQEVSEAGGGAKRLAWPSGRVILIGALCFVSFLAEGAMLDWSAVFLRFSRGFSAASAGTGYAAFSVAMAAGRLTGDWTTQRLGPVVTLRLGGALAAAGLLVAVLTTSAVAALLGFVMVGLGAANVVPALFSAAGRSRGQSTHISIPFITTLGYAGILTGPALIGLAAHLAGLPMAMAGIAMLLLIVSACAEKAAGTAPRAEPPPTTM